MKHYYPTCPDNQDVPDGPTPWRLKETSCPRCLQKEILYYEDWYQHEPEAALSYLKRRL